MDKPLDRRRMMALAGATGIVVPLATTHASAAGSRGGRKKGKQVVAIPKDNLVLASSIAAVVFSRAFTSANRCCLVVSSFQARK